MKIGFSYRETCHLYMGQWHDYFEVYKEQYNFEIKKMIYKTVSDYKVADLDSL